MYIVFRYTELNRCLRNPEVVYQIWGTCRLSAGQHYDWPLSPGPVAGKSGNSGEDYASEVKTRRFGSRCLCRRANPRRVDYRSALTG